MRNTHSFWYVWGSCIIAMTNKEPDVVVQKRRTRGGGGAAYQEIFVGTNLRARGSSRHDCLGVSILFLIIKLDWSVPVRIHASYRLAEGSIQFELGLRQIENGKEGSRSIEERRRWTIPAR